MRVLVANKFWYRRGGLENVMFGEVAALEAAGHDVAHFATSHPRNEPSPWSSYFVPYIELGADGGLGPGHALLAASRMFHNPVAARSFARLLDDFEPDVVHAHGIHRQISPSILDVARRRGVPVVETLHDHHHVCPSDTLLYKGSEVCAPRRCRRLWYAPCVSGRCVRDSAAASALSAVETSWQRLRGAYERGVARFISPSEYMAAQMRAGGWTVPCDVVRNCVDARPPSRAPREGMAYVGRLAVDKGVRFALAAARTAGVRLTVAGEGPLGAALRAEFPDAGFVGCLDRAGVDELVCRSRAVVVPSLGAENAPLSVLEAMAAGTPVIASDVAGIPEMVRDGQEGLLAAPGDVGGLARAMRVLEDDDGLARRLGERGRATAAQRFSPREHLRSLLSTYAAAGAPA